jgi:hypothetical protein
MLAITPLPHNTKMIAGRRINSVSWPAGNTPRDDTAGKKFPGA